MAALTQSVVADGVVYTVGTERTPELGEKIPAQYWDAPADEADEADEKPARSRTKAKSE